MLIEKLQFNTIHSILTSESPGNSISMKSRLLTSVHSGTVIVKSDSVIFLGIQRTALELDCSQWQQQRLARVLKSFV